MVFHVINIQNNYFLHNCEYAGGAEDRHEVEKDEHFKKQESIV